MIATLREELDFLYQLRGRFSSVEDYIKTIKEMYEKGLISRESYIHETGQIRRKPNVTSSIEKEPTVSVKDPCGGGLSFMPPRSRC